MMRHELHLVCCWRGDEQFLPAFVKGWRATFEGRPGVKARLVVAADVDDPPHHGIVPDVRRVPLIWPKSGPIAAGMVETLKAARDRWGCEWIFKHDADVVHRSAAWFDDSAPGRADLVGIASQRGGVFGGAYGIRAAKLGEMDESGPWCSRYEDLAMTVRARELGWRVVALPWDSPEDAACRGAGSLGWDMDAIGPRACWVHAGEGGKSPKQRARSIAWHDELTRKWHD